jgi:hypothetical protein
MHRVSTGEDEFLWLVVIPQVESVFTSRRFEILIVERRKKKAYL